MLYVNKAMNQMMCQVKSYMDRKYLKWIVSCRCCTMMKFPNLGIVLYNHKVERYINTCNNICWANISAIILP